MAGATVPLVSWPGMCGCGVVCALAGWVQRCVLPWVLSPWVLRRLPMLHLPDHASGGCAAAGAAQAWVQPPCPYPYLPLSCRWWWWSWSRWSLSWRQQRRGSRTAWQQGQRSLPGLKRRQQGARVAPQPSYQHTSSPPLPATTWLGQTHSCRGDPAQAQGQATRRRLATAARAPCWWWPA